MYALDIKRRTIMKKIKKLFICIIAILLAFALGILVINIKNCAPKYDTYEFGMYPQTLIEDSELNMTLNNEISHNPLNEKVLTTSDNPSLNCWKKYDYYILGEKTPSMFCIDIKYDNQLYRGVIIKKYRPNDIRLESNTENTRQDDNGFLLDTVYWFKYEKIKWRILKDKGDSLFLMCNSVIDSQPYNNNYSTNINSIYPCAYEISTIRKWLNEDFYKLAFSNDEKNLMIKMKVDNSYESVNVGSKIVTETNLTDYLGFDTSDFVTLLSLKELTNNEYGFKEYSTQDYDKNKEMVDNYSDYSKIQGHWISLEKNTWWTDTDNRWLTRSPYIMGYGILTDYVSSINCEGRVDLTEITNTSNGIVPVIEIKKTK